MFLHCEFTQCRIDHHDPEDKPAESQTEILQFPIYYHYYQISCKKKQ